MNTSDLLEQLLRAGQGSASAQGASAGGQGGLGDLLGGLLGGGSGSAGVGLGGLLGGLLGDGPGSAPGSGQARSGGSNYAMLASLGMMAYQAFQSWQQQQASVSQEPPQTVDQLSGAEAEAHSHAILRALIAAAKADGGIDEQERQMIRTELARHADDPQLKQWLNDEVAKPLDAREVASAAENEAGIAAEMYLASVMLTGVPDDAERGYLDELAAALQLDPQLQVQLEQQAKEQQAKGQLA
ncbi:DUF533 domain-containing protein [Pseudomonas sp. NPDC090202]|uniref:DUF533 domain-containing protein n=1 Tax=unclassified Pseudomonas TaxID=196821 RepID=UPI00381CE4E5